MEKNIDPLPFGKRQNHYQHIIPGSLGSIIRGFKIGVTKWFRANTHVQTVWQRNFWEHIIRDNVELFYIRDYIRKNPEKIHLETNDKFIR